ncbi:MAG: hypothetical protein ACK5FE_04695 [Cyanobacteriota bacterium]
MIPHRHPRSLNCSPEEAAVEDVAVVAVAAAVVTVVVVAAMAAAAAAASKAMTNGRRWIGAPAAPAEAGAAAGGSVPAPARPWIVRRGDPLAA